jgi:cold-inducible RNA-binding protein
VSNRIFVGNIPYDATELELKEFFKKAGNITQVVIPKDRESGKPRGFAFVEFETASQMQEAVFRFNNTNLRDRKIIVSEAKKKEATSSSSSSSSSSSYSPRGRSSSSAQPAPAMNWDIEEEGATREKKFKRELDFEESSKAKKRMLAEISEKKARGTIKEKGGRIYSYEEEDEGGGEEDFVPVYMKAPEDGEEE